MVMPQQPYITTSEPVSSTHPVFVFLFDQDTCARSLHVDQWQRSLIFCSRCC